MRKNKNCKSTLPTAGKNTCSVKGERRRQKIQTSDSCFASRKGKCSVLNVSKCEGLKCGFYKTAVQIEEARIETYKKIKSLDKALQRYIADKYYGGRISWMKGSDE